MSDRENEGSVRLVLHPGHPKCGSSSIQHALYSNIQALRERGVFIPARRPNRVFHEACERRDFTAVEKWLDEFLAEVRQNGGDTVVISAENLGVRRMVTEGRPTHEIFARRFQPVHVIYYIRRQDDWMVSMWQQQGHKQGLGLAQFIEARLANHQPDYLTTARCFEEVYRTGSVDVVPLQRRALVGEDLIVDFCHRAGLGPLPVGDEDHRRNASMGGFLCDVLARVPHVYDQALVWRASEGITDVSVRRLLERWVGSRDLLFSSDKRIMAVAQRRWVLGQFEDDNHALNERYFPDVPFDVVFGMPAASEGDDLQALRDRVDGLQNVAAIQMELILKLLRNAERRRWGDAVKRRARAWRKRLREVTANLVELLGM